MIKPRLLFASTVAALAAIAAAPAAVRAQSGPLGIFESHTDVGVLLHPGASGFDAAKKGLYADG